MTSSDSLPGASPSPPQDPAREVDLGLPNLGRAVEIGRGAAGVVYRAEQPGVNRAVAVKMLPFAGMDESARLRFERECQAMGSLSNHPGIVTVYDAGFTPSGQPYIIMELMEGGTLNQALARKGRFTWEEASEIGIRLAGALAAAHQKGVLHRDVKPDNVLISAYGDAKLADFSIARIAGHSQTQTGLISATPAHAAPEILRGDPPSPQADIYSLASTVVTLLLGGPAFVRDSDTNIYPVLARVERDPVPDMRPLGVPDPVCRVLERAMAKEPAQRQPSAESFARDLVAARDAARSGTAAWGAGVGATMVAATPDPSAIGATSVLATPAPPWGASPAPPPAPPWGAPPAAPPAPGPSTPLPTPSRRPPTAVLAAGLAVLLVGGGGAGVLLATHKGSGSGTASATSSASASQPAPGTPASTGSTGSSTSTGAATSSATASSGGTDTGAALATRLLAVSDLPSGYAVDDNGKLDLGGVNPCNIDPDLGGKVSEADAGFQNLDATTGALSELANSIGGFNSGGATAYLNSVDTNSQQCTSFTSAGAQVTLTRRTGAALGDEVVRFDLVTASSIGDINSSFVLVRRGDRVALVAVSGTEAPADNDTAADALAQQEASRI